MKSAGHKQSLVTIHAQGTTEQHGCVHMECICHIAYGVDFRQTVLRYMYGIIGQSLAVFQRGHFRTYPSVACGQGHNCHLIRVAACYQSDAVAAQPCDSCSRILRQVKRISGACA